MKNSRIVRAYDSINPSIEEKQRMLDVILQEANLEEKPTKQRKKREPVVYTAKPTKVSRRSTIMTIAASLVMLLISGIVLMQMIRQPQDVSMTNPAETVNTGTQYDAVLNKYKKAIAEGWSKEQCEMEGISTRFYMPEPVDYTIGKRILDINNDGRAELLIGHDDIIWDLYTTLEDGTPIQLLSDEQDGWQYYLNTDGLIAAEYFSKDDCYAEYYTLKGHQLVMELQLQYRDGQWMRQLADQEWEEIIADSAEATMNSFVRFTPDWLPIQDNAQMDTDALERYTPILEKYRTALTENWTWEQCVEYDVSQQIVNNATIKKDLGWCLKDLDENGAQELIITDGVHLVDLYTSQHETGKIINILRSNPDIYTLCKDGTIEKRTFFSKGTSWSTYRLSDGEMKLEYMLVYRNEYEGTQSNEQYYYGTSEDNVQPISKDEAGSMIVNEYKESMKLALTPFIEEEPFYPDAELYYRLLRELYQRALDEHWDPPTCLENGLSLMVAHRGEYYDQLGYTIKDLDRNGVSELIITDGTNIYDLYTLIQDEEVVPLQLASAMERLKYYLTEDNLIYFFGSGSASSNYRTVQRLSGRDLILIEGYFFDGKKDPPWYSYDGENIGEPCGFDEEYFKETYRTVTIPFTPFE